ncbi:hypothetical protein [Kluyvera intermedia]|jgi:hypothetical protein|uniref:hypothetical protein n=1 Tax=Kluyvera intermedia TaxID=61648 RepID=UPI0035241CF2
MICFESDLAYYLTFDFWNKRTDIIVAIIAFAALLFTIIQIGINKREARRATAFAAYNEYLKLSFDFPQYSYGLKNKIIVNGSTDLQYPWFVSRMLFCFEQILVVEKDNEEWLIALESQLSKHSWYLIKSKSVKRNEWSRDLKKIINKVI